MIFSRFFYFISLSLPMLLSCFSSLPWFSFFLSIFILRHLQILKDDAVKVLHPICQQIWKTRQWPQDWKRSVFIPIPKKGNAKERSNYRTIALISQASKVMLKILQARLQQYLNRELPDFQAGFRKGRRTKKSNCQHPLDHRKSKRVPEKHLFLLYWLCQSLWLCGSQ